MSSQFACLFLLASAGFVQASFALPVKFFRSWQWEQMWVAQAITSNLLFPFLWACFLPAHFWPLVSQVPAWHWAACYGLGLLWGIGGMAYGLTLTTLGISFAYSFVFGTTTLTGALLPLVFSLVDIPNRPRLFALGLTICLTSIIAVGVLRRASPTTSSMPMPIRCRSYRWALVLALAGGVFSASYGLAFSIGFEVVRDFIRAGVPAFSASLVVALPVYLGSATAAITAGLLCAARSGTLGYFFSVNAGWNWFLALLMGVCGTGGVILYSLGSSVQGHAPPNVSFGLFMTVFVLAGNSLGWLTGELRGGSTAASAGLLLSIGGLIGAAWLLNLR